MANNQNINNQIDFASLGAQLSRTIADAFSRGSSAGLANFGKAFTGSSFLEDLNDQMDQFQKNQKASELNTRAQNLAMRTGVDIKELELKLMAKQAIAQNKLAIAEATRAGDYEMARILTDENTEIKKQVEERRKQLVEETKQEEIQRQQIEASERLKEIDRERTEMLKKINEKAELFKQIFTDRRMAFAALTAGAIKFGNAFSDAYKEVKASGQSVTQALTSTFTSFTDSITTSISSGFLVSADSIRKARQAVLETGGTLEEAGEAGKEAALMAEKFGGSVESAAKAVENLRKLPGLTKEAAKNTAELGAKMAIAASVPADTVTKAVAENMDAAAKAGPSMTKSFATAAINAQKIGIQFATLTGLAEKLLDFESSINAQTEASVLLGKEINLDRAREAALQGDYATVQKEILKNVGSEVEFTKMNVLQKQKLAESLGVSVGDLAKMVKGQGELSDGTSLEANAREKSYGWLTGMVDLGAKHAGTLLGMIPTLASMILQYKTLKVLQGDQSKGVGGFFKSLFGGNKQQAPGTMPGPNMNRPGPDGIVSNLGKNMTGVLKGAAAAALIAGALFILAKAMQEFQKVSWEAMGKAAVGLIALTGAVLGLGMLMNSTFGAVAILAGAAALVIMGGAVGVLAIAIKEMGEGFALMEPALKLLTALGAVVPNLLQVGGALVDIKNGLAGIGEAGGTAMPILNKLVELNASQGGGSQESPVVAELKNLNAKFDTLSASVRSQPVVVQIDGSAIVKAVRQNSNLSRIGTGT